jgi:hypothetical protein
VSLSLLDKLSFMDRYVASLAPESVSLVRLKAGLKPGAMETLHAGFIAPVNTKPWTTAVAELEKLLMKSQRGLPLSVVLSNQLVRYRVIPAMPPLTAADKVLTVATHCFRETYGDVVDDWLVRVNPLPDGDTLIASAVDSGLIAALQALSQQYGCRLKSIQPYLMSGFNRIRHQIKPAASCYVQLESGRINIALMRDGAWHSIASCGAGRDWPEQLSALITREMLLAGWQHEQPIIYLSTPDTTQYAAASTTFAASAAWKTVRVTHVAVGGYAASQHQCYSMALSVVG